MGKQTEHYKTVQGDTWDLISKKIWGDSKYKKYFDLLIIANREYTDTVFFESGVELIVPEIEEDTERTFPWR